ncbi:hypothetical protein NMB33_04745 [Burkholderia sp. FXe9]|nr:hypothetical protein NMB33_04745 [Burkholderia sp. FXe9]
MIDSAVTAGAEAGPATQAAAVVTQKAASAARIANFIDVLLEKQNELRMLTLPSHELTAP